MRSGLAHNGDIELFWFDEGEIGAPAVVFVNGAGSPSVLWCRELIDPLLAEGYRVVRFDNRDLGRSTRVPADVAYEIADLADDLAAVMDHLDIEQAHLLGRSMGGMTIMQFAATRPERVNTMTLIYTTPAFGNAGDLGLPGPRQEVLDHLAESAFAPKPTTDVERVERRVADSVVYLGTRYPVNDEWLRAEGEAEAAHAPYAEPGHGPAVMRSPSLVPVLDRLTQSTLVLHGTDDPIIDIAHGRFLDERLPNSTLIEYEGLGHEMPPAFCEEIVEPVLGLLST